MGEVYLAYDNKLERKVALKILPAAVASNRDRMERFIREAKSAAALSHPNIAQIHEIGEHDGIHYIVMEFIDGVTLRDKIHREHTELRKLLRYLQHTAEGLAKAHAAGIVHRDLKPDNLMITADGHAKILDFGLAKLLEQQAVSAGDSSAVATAVMPQHSTPGTVMGTVGYMSPEQALGKSKEIDQRSDIFSFGCILYEAVAGHKAFEGNDTIDTLNKIIREPVRPLSDFRPDVPSHLQRIVRRCLAKDPEDRYQTIKDVGIELRELRRELDTGLESDTTIPSPSVAGSAISTAPVSSSSLPSTSISSAEYIAFGLKKHKLAAAIVLLVLVMVVLGLGLYLRARNTESAIDSVAVLPFENRSNDPETEYLSDGLAESLIYRLSQLPNLKVSPTSSVMRYKGKGTDVKTIASELGVSAVMNGRIAQRGDSLAISVELIDARNNKLIWGEQYDRKMSDLLATQREIATTVTQKLQLKLAGDDTKGVTKRYTENTEAYQLYLKGRFYWNKRDLESLRKAIEQFKGAAEKDPNYALAYVGIADCYAVLPYYGGTPSSEVLPQAKAYALRALEIDDSLGEAHTSLGYVNTLLWNWTEGEKELKRGIELNPNYATAHKWYGNHLGALGRLDEALVEYKRAQELEPLSLIIGNNIAEVYLQKGDLTAAMDQCQRTIELDQNWYWSRQLLGLVYLKQGRNNEALAEAERSVELSKRDNVPLGVLGYIYTQTGKRSEAAALIEELKEKYAKQQANGLDIAKVYLGLGDKEQVFAWLEKDFQSRSATLSTWLSFPPLDSLRDDPRFKDLARRMNLPELK